MAKTLEEWWENESLINRLFVQPLVDLATLPGKVDRGEISPYQMESEVVNYQPGWLGLMLGDEPSTEFFPAGGTSRELIDRSADAGMSIPLAGMASRPAAGMLASGPAFDSLLSAISKETGEANPEILKGLAEYVLANPDNFSADLEKYGVNTLQAAHEFYDNPSFQKGYDEMTAELAQSLPPLTTADEEAAYIQMLKDLDEQLPSEPLTYEEQMMITNQLPDEIPWTAADDAISDPLALKSLDTEAYPWLAKPAEPEEFQNHWSEILDRHDPQFSEIRKELYRRGMSQDPLTEIQQIMAADRSLAPEELERAKAMSGQLRSLLPEDWNYAEGTRYSTVVPHAVDTRGLLTEQIPERMDELLSRPDPENLARAREQGYDLDRVLFRGTRSPTDQFLDPAMKEDERGMFFADNPVIASNYGGYNYPVVTRAKNPVEVDFAGREYGASAPGPWSSGDVNRHIEEARKAGNDMLIFRNLRDDDPGAIGRRSTQDQYVVFDPSIIRSPFAKFDPEKMDVNNLLAAEVPVGINPFVERKKKRRSGGGGF